MVGWKRVGSKVDERLVGSSWMDSGEWMGGGDDARVVSWTAVGRRTG